MLYLQYKKRLLFSLLTLTLIMAGCTEQIKQQTRICPGKSTAGEALSALGSNVEKAVPLKANGQCHLEFYIDGKLKKENFPVKLWLNPPSEIYLQGDVAFDPRGLVLGSNENEFWLAIRHKEVSSYWLGRWNEVGSVEGLLLDPRVVIEALGIIAAASDKKDMVNWSLSKEGAFDVLTRLNKDAGTIKKIYIFNCDYSVRKIQYFNIDEQFELIVELDKFAQVTEGFIVPCIIKVSKIGKNLKEPTIVFVSLTSIKSTSFNAKQRNVLFNHPEQEGFKHFFINIDGKWVEQKQD